MAKADIRIGAAISDVSGFVAVDPAYGIGDQRGQVEVAVDAARARGYLPIAGRDLELVFRTFDAVDPEDKRAVADAFAADGVAAVLGARDFTYGAVALAERHGIPVLDVNAVPSTLHRRCGPCLFTLRAAQDILYRRFVRWAHATGALDGRRLGIFSDRYTDTSTAAARQQLAALGHEVALHVVSDGLGYGSDDDRTAAERFAAAGVQVILPFVSGSSLVELLRAAVDLAYVPTIVDLETGEHTADVTASLMSPSIYEGTWALTMNRVGEAAAGLPPAVLTEQAIRAYENAAGVELERCGRASSGELSNVLITADLVSLLAAALRHAGGDPRPAAVVAGFESIAGLPVASGCSVTFAPGEHWGLRLARPVQWSAPQGAWVARGPYEPLSAT